MPLEQNIIAGGGPGGLAAALALTRAGFAVRVLERAPSPDAGAAFTLWPNAMKALDQLGVGADVRAVSSPFDGIAMLERDGRELFRVNGATLQARFGQTGWALERREFLDILMGHLGREHVQFGRACTSFEQSEESVAATLDDGTVVTGRVLIGADGLHSMVRTQLHGTRPLRYAGYTVWRGVSNCRLADSAALTSLGCGSQAGLFPMSRDRVYWFASSLCRALPRSSGTTQSEPDSAQHRRDDVLSRFADWCEPVRRVIEQTPEACIVRNDIFDMDPLPMWGRGRVTLLGDAAHPSTPDLGQGLCQAIEDAVVLAGRLRAVADIPVALRAYEERRKPRTRWITLQSRRIGKSGAWTNGLACYLRNQMIRVMPAAMHLAQLEQMFRFEA